jgi:asparagine synthetase B (glutamine-hydrolysing)
MCSILFSTKNIDNIDHRNRFMKLRGPDSTNIIDYKGCTFLHNLLSITGTFTPQPLVDDDIVIIFNGEIYNFKEFGDYDNDTKCIIPLYKKYGNDFVKKLDGEFAIVLADFKNNILIVTGDVFCTKPLWYAIEGKDIGVASYKSGLEETYSNIKMFDANTTLIFDMLTGIYETKTIYDFNLDQYKTNFDDWNKAFSNSIKKRSCQNMSQKLFIGMSSGYDSGALICEMIKQGAKFKAFSVIGSENKEILDKRYNILTSYPNCELEVLTITPSMRNMAHQYLLDNTEEFKYTIYSARSNYSESYLSLWDDNGSNGLSYVCSKAKLDDRKVFMSGAGADELFSDYAWNGSSKYQHSNFLGVFPENLETIFPTKLNNKPIWASFYSSSMCSYLKKDEFVTGSYSQEGRYPFLDTEVVQEFLNITHTLKNSQYKSVIGNYLNINNFPFSPNEKIGF